MAEMKSIDKAGTRLEEASLELVTLMKVLSDLADENEPGWLWLVKRRVFALDDLVEEYVSTVNEQARAAKGGKKRA